MNITKRLIKERLGLKTDVQVADWFGITKQAVGRWEEDDAIPLLQRYRAIEKRPDLFGDEAQAA